ncbi:MAG: Lrp/AsnC ligand binding domain-containing protein [Euzebyales bacterium]|nr:Lrp/AsnC ligand binding domain-containing protein [Euzebyales bacterium]
MITAIVLLTVDVHAIPETAQAIADIDRVSEVYSVTGDWELVALVRVHAHEEIAEVVTGGIAKVLGVRGTHTMIAFQAFSNSDLDRLWGIGFEDAEGV